MVGIDSVYRTLNKKKSNIVLVHLLNEDVRNAIRMDLNIKNSHNIDGDTQNQRNDMEHDSSHCKQRKEGQITFLSSVQKYV